MESNVRIHIFSLINFTMNFNEIQIFIFMMYERMKLCCLSYNVTTLVSSYLIFLNICFVWFETLYKI